MGSSGLSAALVGRERDLDVLVERVLAGRSVAVVGAFGSGKSFLLDALVEALAAEGVPVRRCASPGLGPDGVGPAGGVLVLDDAQFLGEEAVRALVTAIEHEGLVTVLGVMPDPQGRLADLPGVTVALDPINALWRDGFIDRHDLGATALADAEALIDALPGGAALDSATRTAMWIHARGSRKVLLELARQAIDAPPEADPLDGVAAPAPRIIDLLVGLSARTDEANDVVVLALHRLGGVRRSIAERLLDADRIESMLAVGRLFELPTTGRLYANQVSASVARARLGGERVEEILRSLANRSIELGLDREDWAVAAKIADRWAAGRPTSPALDEIDPRRRIDILARAARLANDLNEPDRALGYARASPADADDPSVVVEAVRALIGSGRYEQARTRLAGAALDEVPVDLARGLLRTSVYELGVPGEVAALVATAFAGERAVAPGVVADARPSAIAAAMADLRWVEAHALAVEALDDPPSSRYATLRSLLLGATATVHLGLLDATQALYREIRRRAANPATGIAFSPVAELWILLFGAFHRSLTGVDFVDFEERFPAARDAVAKQWNRPGLALATLASGVDAYARGEWALAIRDLEMGIRRAPRSSLTDWVPGIVACYLDALIVSGRIDEVEHALAGFTARVDRPSALQRYLRTVTAAKALLARGDATGAASLVRAAMALGGGSPLLEQRDWLRLWSIERDQAQLDAIIRAQERVEFPRAREFAAIAMEAAEGAPGAAARRAVPPGVASAIGAGRGDRDASSLSGREREIARLVADGLTNRQIAERLYLSVRTVESHIFQARAKVGAVNRKELGELVLAS